MTALHSMWTHVQALIGSAVFTSIAAWLGKLYLERRITSEKAQWELKLQDVKDQHAAALQGLKAQGDIELQKLKDLLDRRAKFEARAVQLEFDAYPEIAKQVSSLMSMMNTLFDLHQVSPPEGKKPRDFWVVARDAHVGLGTYLDEMSPFLDQALIRQLDTFLDRCAEEIKMFGGVVVRDEDPSFSNAPGRRFDPQEAVRDAREANREITVARNAVDVAMRSRLDAIKSLAGDAVPATSNAAKPTPVVTS